MIPITRSVSLLPPQPITIGSKPIEDAPPTPLRRAPAPPAGGGTPRLFATLEQNSRLPGPVPASGWKLAWTGALEKAFTASVVVQDGDRVVAYGGPVWRMFDLAGNAVKSDRYGSSGIVLDGAAGLAYFMDTNGFLAARKLSSGDPEFITDVTFGSTYHRRFVARRGQRFIVVGVEMWVSPHQPNPPKTSLIEHIDMGAPLELDDIKSIKNLVKWERLHMATATLVAAMHGDDVVFAVPNRLVLSSSELHPRVAFDGNFVPKALSLDELGRAHLLVTVGDRPALWVVGPDGRRTVNVPLPAEVADASAPPIVGYDHRIYVVTASAIAAFDETGKLLWLKKATSRLMGALVSTDDRLLVASGSDLSLYDAHGNAATVFSVPGTTLTSAPALGSDGRLYFASADTLYAIGR